MYFSVAALASVLFSLTSVLALYTMDDTINQVKCKVNLYDELATKYHFEDLWDEPKQTLSELIIEIEDCSELDNEIIRPCQDQKDSIISKKKEELRDELDKRLSIKNLKAMYKEVEEKCPLFRREEIIHCK